MEAENATSPWTFAHGLVIKIPAMTYSRAIRTTIGPGCLTAVFGMGTGVTNQVCSPERRLETRHTKMMNAITRAPVSGIAIGSDKSCSLKILHDPWLACRGGIAHGFDRR